MRLRKNVLELANALCSSGSTSVRRSVDRDFVTTREHAAAVEDQPPWLVAAQEAVEQVQPPGSVAAQEIQRSGRPRRSTIEI